MAEIAKESGHWYDPVTGEPRYTYINNKGKEKKTTLREAKRYGWMPSVTEVIKILPKWGLIEWQKKQVLMSALTLSRKDSEPDEAYITRIMADANEQARQAREKGIAIHGAIECHFLGQMIETEYVPYVAAVISCLQERFGSDFRQHCEPEKSFACPEGFGGKVDLHSRSLNFVLDFKTKEFTEETKKLAWDEHAIQLNAYRRGLGMPDAMMLNCFVSTSVPGLVRLVEQDGDNEYYWNVFLKALELWKILKRV